MQKQIFILCRKQILYSAEKSFIQCRKLFFFFFFSNQNRFFVLKFQVSPKKDCYFKKTFEKDFEEKHLKNTFLKKLWKKKYCIIF